MTPMAPTRPTRPVSQLPGTAFRECRVRLPATLAAAAQARMEIDMTVCAWQVPVDTEVAVLLTSELVANAVTHGAGEYVILAVSCDRNEFRVDVHDASGDLPVLEDVPADAETGRGLLLVTSLSTEWGFYRTPAGKAVYFVLALQPDVHERVTGLDDDVDPR
jgi:anti-sigma regulatory factor (Ser/Thr protein kinase)